MGGGPSRIRLSLDPTKRCHRREPASQRRGLRIRYQAGMKFHVEADTVVFELLPLPSLHREAGSASYSA